MLRYRNILHITTKITTISTLNTTAKTKHLVDEPATLILTRPDPHPRAKSEKRTRPLNSSKTRLQEASRHERTTSRISVNAAARDEGSLAGDSESTHSAHEDAPVAAVGFT